MNVTTRPATRCQRGKTRTYLANINHITRVFRYISSVKEFRKIDIRNDVFIAHQYIPSVLNFLLHHKFVKRVIKNNVGDESLNGVFYVVNPEFKKFINTNIYK